MIMKKLKQLGLVAILAVVCVLAGNTAMAQQQQQERAASGQSNTLGSSSRIDATKVTVNKFISAQEANISGIELTVNQTHTTMVGRLGTIRNTLVNFNTTPGGCDPRLGPQGCKCACGAPDQKLLWDASASKWQCYQVQNPQCASGMQFNPNTCKCESTVCQPRSCPTGQTWDYANCKCKPCDGTCPGECPVGMRPITWAQATACGLSNPCICADYIMFERGGRTVADIHPGVIPVANISNDGASGCKEVRSCKYGMEIRRDGLGPRCCCPDPNQRFLSSQNRCGDVCPTGYLTNMIAMDSGQHLVTCYKKEYYTTTTTCASPDTTIDNTQATCNTGNGERCCRKGATPTEFGLRGKTCTPDKHPDQE